MHLKGGHVTLCEEEANYSMKLYATYQIINATGANTIWFRVQSWIKAAAEFGKILNSK